MPENVQHPSLTTGAIQLESPPGGSLEVGKKKTPTELDAQSVAWHALQTVRQQVILEPIRWKWGAVMRFCHSPREKNIFLKSV